MKNMANGRETESGKIIEDAKEKAGDKQAHGLKEKASDKQAQGANEKADLSAKISAILVALILATGMLGLFFFPKREYSETENRYLAKLPEVNAKAVFDGSWMDDYVQYLTDQFPVRDVWIMVNSQMQKTLGQKEINGVYLGSDQYLMAQYDASKNTDRIASTFAKFAKKSDEISPGARRYLMLVPTAITIYEDKLPANAPVHSQLETISEIYQQAAGDYQLVDAYASLKQAKESYAAMLDGFDGQSAMYGQLFYRTDHHWTTLGAYYGYRALCETMGLEAIPLDHFKAELASNNFYGTYDAKVHLPGQMSDSICLYTNPDDSLSVEYEEGEPASSSLYNLEYTRVRDQYALFLNHLHSLVTVQNTAAQSGRVLVLVKDSYANSMVPFLTAHFDTIYIFDTRYYKDGVSSFLKDHEEVTDVLLLYNMSTIDTDTGIRGIY